MIVRDYFNVVILFSFYLIVVILQLKFYFKARPTKPIEWEYLIFTTMETAKCKWCGREISREDFIRYGGYCCVAHYQAGMQRQR